MQRLNLIRDKTEYFGKTGSLRHPEDLTSNIFKQYSQHNSNPEQETAVFPVVHLGSFSSNRVDTVKEGLLSPIVNKKSLRIQDKLIKMVKGVQQKREKKDK